MISDDNFDWLMESIPKLETIWLAYSGGLDSHVLLHALQQYVNKKPSLALAAIHINHQLSTNADAWQQHCQSVCQSLDIPFYTETVTVKPQPGESLEACARNARYQALKDYLAENDCLLTAHHQDDQAETVLLQLMRGAGPRGLAAMPRLQRFAKGYLARPLLGYQREQLNDYALAHQLDWIEDESNHNLAFDRNFMRQQILPQLRQRWPAVSANLSRSAKHCGEASDLLATLADLDNEELNKKKEASIKPLEANALLLSTIKQLNEARQRNLLRHWLIKQKLPLPNEKKLQQLIDTVINARQDAKPQLSWAGVEIRRYRQYLYAFRSLNVIPPTLTLQWSDVHQSLILPTDLGCLRATKVVGKGIIIDSKQPLELRFNTQGIRARLAGRDGTRSLKKCFQEWGVPPWQRSQVPLLFQQDQLVAIIGYAICEGYQAKVAQPAWEIQLQTNQ